MTVAVAVGCSGGHFVKDKDFRRMVEADYAARTCIGGLDSLMALPEGISRAEREALVFLYAYMPLADLADYPADYWLENTRAAFRAREEMPWDIPEREFRHFVLPVRVNNESLDGHRTVFYEELKPWLEGLSLQEAILEVNHWCHEKVTYQPSDARTSSPLNTVKNALGRCGEESTFTVAALRAVGIPARQVYTPRWAHTDDNHAWVEAWADGRWWFLGACEPEPVLNLGWFNAPASRALLMHTRVFGRYDGPEEVVLQGPNYTEINLIDQYASTGRVCFEVQRADGSPAAGARVDFCIYNYAEFYPAVTKYADETGRTFLTAGRGDMLVWASLDGAYGFAKVNFGTDETVTVVLNSPVENAFYQLVPPPEQVNLPEVSPELRALNDRRLAYEDSLRTAYEATFLNLDEARILAADQGFGEAMAERLVRARGNWATLENFLARANDRERAEVVLASLSTKDLHDITPELLEDYYAAEPFLGARIEDAFLSSFYGFFQVDRKEAVLDDVLLLEEPAAWSIPVSPEGSWKAGVADKRSLELYTVALLRARGQEARKDPVTGKLQLLQDGTWLDFSESPAEAPKGTLFLDYTPTKIIDKPKYYSHFTLSRIENGRPRLLAFDEGEVVTDGVQLDAGDYLLVSGNRLSNGSVPVTLRFFTLEEGAVLHQELRIEAGEGGAPVIGTFDCESKICVDGESVSILSQTGRGTYVLALLDPGKEPTNHALRDLAAERERLEAWGRPILLLCPSEEALQRLRKEMEEGRYGQLPATVLFGVATAGDGRSEPAMTGTPEPAMTGTPKPAMTGTPEPAMTTLVIPGLTGNPALPVVLVADSFNHTFFLSEGYTIGLGTQLAQFSLLLRDF